MECSVRNERQSEIQPHPGDGPGAEERLSAMVDGELQGPEASALLRRLPEERALSQRWDEYHLIGDVLRGTPLAGFDAGRFGSSLAAEPLIFAPGALAAPRGLQRALGAAALAAGVGALAVALWVAMPGGRDARLATLAAAPVQDGRAGVPDAVGVQDYLLAHQRFASSALLQGAAPYVRLVDDRPTPAARGALRSLEAVRQ
jgi:sigma-E factor negative regulatory protein RseA